MNKSRTFKMLPTALVLFLLLAGVAVPLVSIVTAASPPPVLYVSTSGSDTMGSGSVVNPYATIAHALSIATTGSTIMVEPGTYAGELIVVTTKVILKSESSQPYNTIINATGEPNGIAVVGPASNGTIIEGFTFENANNKGIYVQDSQNVVVENNFVENNGLNALTYLGENKAIQLTGTSDSTVSGNSVVSNLWGGIGVADDGPIAPSWNVTALPMAGIPASLARPSNNNTISGNFIAENKPNHCAIVVSAYNQGEGVTNNLISDNVVVDNQNGIIIAADTPNTVASDNIVINNNVMNNGEGGVIVHSNAPGDVVTGNVITGNVFNANGYLPTLEGVILGGFGPVPLQNTTVTNNVFQNEVVGIQIVNAQGTLVGGNTMMATVKLGVNGTVTYRTAAVVTTTFTTTQLVTQSVTVSGVATTVMTTSSGGIAFTVALFAAVAMLVVGIIAGVVVGRSTGRKGNQESSGR